MYYPKFLIQPLWFVLFRLHVPVYPFSEVFDITCVDDALILVFIGHCLLRELLNFRKKITYTA